MIFTQKKLIKILKNLFRCLADVTELKRYVEVLVELLLLEVDTQKFGFQDLATYAKNVPNSIFHIVRKEIELRVR